MGKIAKINFVSDWVDSNRFEETIHQLTIAPHNDDTSKVIFIFPVNCKIMIDAALRILSLANQLSHAGKKVVLSFEDEQGTIGYLDRMGFFDYLLDDILVLPERPVLSGAEVYRGYNPGLVEISKINPKHRDKELPSKLSQVLEDNLVQRSDHQSLGTVAYTVFAELVDNIFRHSSTELDGYAALQVYPRGGRVKVLVSDSGSGIIDTLRPSLEKNYPKLMKLSDTDLIVEAFQNGLSRFGRGQGCGLKMCATQAIKFQANLDMRLPRSRVHLVPSPDGYTPAMAYCYDAIPLIWGTHFCFNFKLDNRK